MSPAWIHLTNIDQLATLREESFRCPVLIFKHSTRCGTSSMAWSRMERLSDSFHAVAKTYFLDVLSYRTLSNAVADDFHVYHESPQLLLIKDGECIYEASHLEISPKETEEQYTAFF
jgi:bacillithiol system protein YtxJ